MSHSVLVMSPDEGSNLQFDKDAMVAAVRERFGEHDLFVARSDEPSTSDLTIYVTRPGVSGFGINHFRIGDTLSYDGTPQQQAEVTALATTLFPAPLVGRVWLVDQAYSGHAVLTPGMSAHDVKMAWVEHVQGNPDLGKRKTRVGVWAGYKRTHAGADMLQLSTHDGLKRIWTDGLAEDPDHIVALEVKYVGEPGDSPYEGTSGMPAHASDRMLLELDDEMERYAAVIGDRHNPVGRLRIVTNSEAAADFLRARVEHVLSRTGGTIDLDVRFATSD